MIHVTIQQLSSHLDRELSEGSSALVREHLSSCEACAAKFAKLEAQGATLAMALTREPDDALLDRLTQTIESRIRSEEAGAPRVSPAAPPRPVTATPAHVAPAAPPRIAARPAPAPSPATVPPPATHRASRTAPVAASHARSSFSWAAALVVVATVGSAGVLLSSSRGATSWLQALNGHGTGSPNARAGAVPAQVSTPEPAPAPAPTADVAVAAPPVETASPAPPTQPRTHDERPALARAAKPDREPAFQVPLPEQLTPDPVPVRAGGTDGEDDESANASDDPFAHLDALGLNAVRKAQASEQSAAGQPSADNYDAVATEWERALPVLRGDACREARFHGVQARYMAWQLQPGSDRATRTVSAIRAFLVVAPPGPEREGATGWLLDLDDAGYR